jgi:hypothetical protein
MYLNNLKTTHMDIKIHGIRSKQMAVSMSKYSRLHDADVIKLLRQRAQSLIRKTPVGGPCHLLSPQMCTKTPWITCTVTTKIRMIACMHGSVTWALSQVGLANSPLTT